MDKKVLTLCMVYDDKRILLGMKKRGFGMSRWNGFGGKVERGETIEAVAVRELKEEAGITARDIKKRGVLHFFLRIIQQGLSKFICLQSIYLRECQRSPMK